MAQADQHSFHSESRSDTSDPDTSEVLRQLERILANPIFGKSPQAARLLSFLVRETLSGSVDDTRNNLKEYSIAIHVFGRQTNFDPSSDNIVRVEVRRVRSKLDRYYAGEGLIDPVIITIPKGAYVPIFESRDSSESDLSGRVISHYQLVNRTCVNRWQSTYQANSLHLQRSVIVILPTRLALEDEHRRHSLLTRTRAEVIDHSNVAAVYNVEASDERVIIATAVLPGRPLREYVEQERLSGHAAFDFAREFAAALASAHALGITHANLNPFSVNVEIGTTRDGAHPAIMPFGLGPLVDVNHYAFDGCRAPEWAAGSEPDIRSDVWCFGALIWLACYGTPPPENLNEPSSQAENAMPVTLARVVHRCLAHDPELRYANAGEILEDLAPPSQSSVYDKSEYRKTVALATALSALLLVAIAVFVYLQWQRAATSTLRTSTNYRIIVLPFTNVSGKPEDEPYARGVAELLASRLALLPGIDLVSSRFLPPGKTDQLSIEYLQQKLRIDYVLDGTLFKRGDTFEATARLTHVSDGKYSWTRSYGGRWSQIFQTFDEISDGAVQAMSLIVGTDGRIPSSPAQANSQALDRLMKATFFVSEFSNTHSSDAFEQAEDLLTQSLAIDPNYVDAMIESAQLHRRAAFPPQGNQLEALQKAAQFADSALALEPDNSRAQSLRGAVFVDLGQPRLALKHLRSALKDSPRNPATLSQLSIAYEEMGFWESGLAEIERAIEGNPFTQGSSEIRAGLLSRLGRFPEAIQALDIVEQKSGTWRASMAGILVRAGKPDRAAEILKRPPVQEPPGATNVVNALEALIKAAHGDKSAATRVLDGLPLNERRRSDFVPLLCAVADKKTQMIDQIEHWTNLSSYRWLINQPLLRPYRTDPEFQELVRRLHREWEKNVTDFNSTLPVKPPKLPSPEEYFK